ncbi:CocE/NonD family hydrolase [Sphingomonas aurantiaca]|uniref:CocE/NonD family hydrolase n=1 Tax=Sphingomonas aurantiaca TaxID=185949 RepID=UPI002FE0D106
MEADDQRFVDHRPDVLGYVSEPLDADLTVTGALSATLQASTSGTDSDFVVKLIDVLPDDTAPFDGQTAQPGDYARTLNGYQLPIAMEVRRGRFLASDTAPQPLVPGKVVAWDVPLRDHDHVFKAGHRIMVQVQSSLVPDDRPQPAIVRGEHRAGEAGRLCEGDAEGLCRIAGYVAGDAVRLVAACTSPAGAGAQLGSAAD